MTDQQPRPLVSVPIALALLMLLPQAAGLAGPAVAWCVVLHADNPDYIDVLVDLSGLPRNTYLTNVSFDVTVMRADGLREQHQEFAFTDDQLAHIRAAEVPYRRYFRHSIPRAASVSGGTLRYLLNVDGSRQKSDRVETTARPPFESSRAKVVGAVPPLGRGRERAGSGVELRDWFGIYAFYEDGLGPITLRIAESRADCASPTWCAMVVSFVPLRGAAERVRIESVAGPHMVFYDDSAGRDVNTGRSFGKRYDAYMLSRDKSRIVGTVEFQQSPERVGFYAERK